MSPKRVFSEIEALLKRNEHFWYSTQLVLPLRISTKKKSVLIVGSRPSKTAVLSNSSCVCNYDFFFVGCVVLIFGCDVEACIFKNKRTPLTKGSFLVGNSKRVDLDFFVIIEKRSACSVGSRELRH